MPSRSKPIDLELILETGVGVKPAPEFKFAPDRRWRFDYAFPAHRVAIELEGGLWVRGRHNSPSGYIKDMEKYNRAAMDGWVVLRYASVTEILKAIPTIKSVLEKKHV